MTAHIDSSGISPHRASPIAQARSHLEALQESLAGGPLPLAPEQARLLEGQVQEALEAIVVACRHADWLESLAGHGAETQQEGRFAPHFESLFGRIQEQAPSADVETATEEDEQLAVVRQRVAQIDETARALASVLGDSRGPLLAAVAIRDRPHVEAIVDAIIQEVGHLAAKARTLCGCDTEGVPEEG